MYARRRRDVKRDIKRTEIDTIAITAALKRISTSLQPIPFEEEQNKLDKARQPGTRTWLLDEIFNWLKDPSSRMFWLKGDPGVGKSVMVAMVANALQGHLHLGAAFYCKHDDVSRRDAKVRFVNTL